MNETELLKLAVESSPQLSHAVQIVSHVQRTNAFPIASHDALLKSFAGKSSVKLGSVAFTKEQVLTYVPDTFFPIVGPEDLFAKMYAALQHGRRIHELEHELHARRTHLGASKRTGGGK